MKLLRLIAGLFTEEVTVGTGGAPSAGKVPHLDASGRVDQTMVPFEALVFDMDGALVFDWDGKPVLQEV